MGAATLRRLLEIPGKNTPKGAFDEADVSTEASTPPANTWLSSSDEDAGRPRHLEAAPCQRTPSADRNRRLEVAVDTPTGSFKRLDRLLRRQEFRYVTRHGQAARLASFVVLAADREESDGRGRVRLGITVSRRVGNATTRNRVKRRIREWFRHQRPRMSSNLDIVVIARRTAAEISQQETIQALNKGSRAVEAMMA